MKEEFIDKLNLMEAYCKEHKFIYSEQAFIMLFNELKNNNLIDNINSSLLEILSLFSLKKHNIISLIKLLLIPEDFYNEDSFGFYYTFNYHFNYLLSECNGEKLINKIGTISPKFLMVYQTLKDFENNLPRELYPKYGLGIKNVIINFIIYNTYIFGKENLIDILFKVVNEQDIVFDRFGLIGVNNYYYINHKFLLLLEYYGHVEMIFKSYADPNYKRIL